MENSQHKTNELIEELDDLKRYSDPLTIERAKFLVEEVLGRSRYDEGGNISLRKIDHSLSQGENRRIFVDPLQSVMSEIMDFLDGRVNSIELIDCSDELFTEAYAECVKYRKQNRPLISVDYSLVKNDAEIVLELRNFADELEKGAQSFNSRMKIEVSSDHHKHTIYEKNWCYVGKVTWGAKHWKPGFEGQVWQQNKCVVTHCSSGSGCSGPVLCVIDDVTSRNKLLAKSGNRARCEIEELWRADKPTENVPADIEIPEFKPIPWNHCIDVVDNKASWSTLNSRFGWRRLSNGLDSFHEGIDIGGPVGTDVQSLDAGIIVEEFTDPSRDSWNLGFWIKSGNQIYKYFHIKPAPDLKKGTKISKGQIIGSMAKWPTAGRQHAHVALYNAGGELNRYSAVDPLFGCEI